MQNQQAFRLNWLFGSFSIHGSDAKSFLQNLITQDLNKLQEHKLLRSFICNAKAQAIFDLYIGKLENGLCLFSDSYTIQAVYDYLEKYHFAEELSFSDIDREVCFKECPTAPTQNAWRLPLFGEDGYLYLSREESAKAISDDEKQALLLRKAKAAYFHIGRDLQENTLSLDLDPLFEMHHPQKGCYPGQEVLARLFTKGGSNKTMFMLKPQSAIEEELIKQVQQIKYQGKKLGKILNVYSQADEQVLLLLGSKSMAFPENEMDCLFELKTCEGMKLKRYKCLALSLPLMRMSREQKEAASLFDNALQHYHKNDIQRAYDLYKQGLALDESNQEATEALAVISERLGKSDEAIAYNKKLKQLNPNNIMAYANLSRLYAQNGFIEEAEKEQNKATQIGMRQNSGQTVDQFNQQQAAENERKKKLFEQALSIDSEDEIALFGLGKLCNEAGDYKLAITHLKKLIDLKEDYSAAYPLLCKALSEGEEKTSALEYAKKGMEIAASQGDMQPQKALQAFIAKASA